MSLRSQALSLYRRLLRLSRTWTAQDPANTAAERDYIRAETQSIFRQNKNVRDENEIKQHLQEGEARIEIALHYKIPYPRHVNFPQHMIAAKSARMKGSQRRLRESRPIYIKSLDKDR